MSKLIKMHEEKIINDAKSEMDEMKQIKIKVKINTPNKAIIFQKMPNLMADSADTTQDMEPVIVRDFKLELEAACIWLFCCTHSI